ncbi:hypothetical protein SLE2022_055790 [Rubroshorea leprosula]
MEQMTLSKLVLLFLSFSYLLLLHPCPSASVPTSRSHLKQNKEDASSVQDLFSQEAMDVTEELLGEEDGLIEGRMLKIITDYSGTGANKNHDPKPPAGT